MRTQLGMVLVVQAFGCCSFYSAVDPLHLASCPRLVRRGEPGFYPVNVADHVKAHRMGVDNVVISRLPGNLNAIAWQMRLAEMRGGENGADLKGYGLQQEFSGNAPVSFFNALRRGERIGPIALYEEVQLALGGLHSSISICRTSMGSR